jgi:hypothetical protein
MEQARSGYMTGPPFKKRSSIITPYLPFTSTGIPEKST